MFKKFMHFWSEERSLTTLLVLLAINMFVLEPVIKEGAEDRLIERRLFLFALVAGLLTMTRHKTVQIVFVVFVTLTMMVHWTRIAFGIKRLSWVGMPAFRYCPCLPSWWSFWSRSTGKALSQDTGCGALWRGICC